MVLEPPRASMPKVCCSSQHSRPFLSCCKYNFSWGCALLYACFNTHIDIMLCSAASYHKSVSVGRKLVAVCYIMGPGSPVSMYERCTEWYLLMNAEPLSETLFRSVQNSSLQPFYVFRILCSIYIHILRHLCASHELILRIFVIPPACLVAIRFVWLSWTSLLLRWIVFSHGLSPDLSFLFCWKLVTLTQLVSSCKLQIYTSCKLQIYIFHLRKN